MRMRFDYCGEIVPRGVPAAFYEGWRDATRLPAERGLYRTLLKNLMWKAGNFLAAAKRG